LLDTLFANHETIFSGMTRKQRDVLKMALHNWLNGYEGIPIESQAIYHNIETLKCMLKGGVAPAHQNDAEVHGILMKSIVGGNAKLPLKIADILQDNIHLCKALIQVERVDDHIKLVFSDK